MDTTRTTNAHMPTSPDLPAGVFFGEATDDQLAQCEALAASAFAQPLSEAEYVEREDFMSKQELAEHSGVRTWCLYSDEGTRQVLAACKTVIREVLVTDHHGCHKGSGYCFASVVTHPDYRGRGLAPILLQNVARWLDGPGDASVSMLYSNKEQVSKHNREDAAY
jgi:GNAT superfamily N-acetyltransferase